jgi:hypothetical protein
MDNEERPEYRLVNVATQTAPMIQDSKEEYLSVEQALVQVLNQLDKLVKKLI